MIGCIQAAASGTGCRRSRQPCALAALLAISNTMEENANAKCTLAILASKHIRLARGIPHRTQTHDKEIRNDNGIVFGMCVASHFGFCGITRLVRFIDVFSAAKLRGRKLSKGW